MDSKGSSEQTDSNSGMWRWVKNTPPPLTAQCWRQMPAMKVSLDVLSSKCACHKTRPKACLPGCTDCATATTLATNGAEGHLLSCAAITDSASMGRNPINLHSTSLCFAWLVTPWTSCAEEKKWKSISLGSASLYQLSLSNVLLFPIENIYGWKLNSELGSLPRWSKNS